MKLNWGHYIVIGFSAFVLLILYMVYRSYQHDNDLVAEDYYARELKFQEVIDRKERADALTENIRWNVSKEGITLQYPGLNAGIKGEIALMRPSDEDLDRKYDIAVEENNFQFIPRADLQAGKYLIQITWEAGGIGYYTEGSIFIQP